MIRCPRTKKLCYPTKEEAEAQLAIIHMLGPVWRREQRLYQCKFCQAWHLTSQGYNPKKEGK